MGLKSSQPALYEKFRHRTGSMPAPIKTDLGPPTPPVITGAAKPAAPTGGNWFSPGRTIRMPVGYVILSCGLVLGLLVAVYMMGFRGGEKREHAKVAESLSRTAVDSPGLATVDPLIDQKQQNGHSVLGSGGTPAPGTGTRGNRPSAAANGTTGPVRTAPPSDWGAVMPQKDPRIKGLNYYILMETNESGAVRLAEFFRSYGVETYAVPVANKSDRRKVIALPGFDAANLNSKEKKDFEAKIVSIGVRWKAAEKDPGWGYYVQLYDN